MGVQSTGEGNAIRPRRETRARSAILTILLMLDSIVAGGGLMLIAVNRLLVHQFNVYKGAQNVDSWSVILDFMDDLLPWYLVCGGALLGLALITSAAWTWLSIESRRARLAVTILCVAIIVSVGALWFLRGTTGPVVPAMTPTPQALSLDVRFV